MPYGMIGLLGAKRPVEFAGPAVLAPVAARNLLALGNVTLQITGDPPSRGVAPGDVHRPVVADGTAR
ncbi:hypothetical protein D0T12_09860 [Actinomadura spongiicola]|uniref:Uncharacterized protein n=1 Tax=Actinomadura spongiicola TaxID=2303421 RepID=A0A372GJR6_9ACTN|nr:hypothetical protein [Actinomadura spongiicola]RFS85343.1 hypothetical protein D0T12_09860 [Actinomadura spongiicola]